MLNIIQYLFAWERGKACRIYICPDQIIFRHNILNVDVQI